MHRPRFADQRRREMLLGLATLLGVGSTPAFGAAQMQTVVDQTGRTVTVPTHPQRVVSLFDIFITLPLYELGVPMVGSTRIGGRDVYALKDLYGITAEEVGLANVGSTDISVDIERVANLAPDLIIADDTNLPQVEQLSRIAPVYFVDGYQAVGLSTQRHLARVLSAENKYAQLNQSYKARVSTLRDGITKFGEDRTFAIIMALNQFYIMRSFGALTHVLGDLGFVIPAEIAKRDPNAGIISFSNEELPLMDADLVIVLPPYAGADQSLQAAKDSMFQVFAGWDRFLPAARENRLLHMPARLAVVPTFAAAHHILDELERASVLS